MRVLVLSLVPSEVLAGLLDKVKAGHPDATITVLTGRSDGRLGDEIWDWRARTAADLRREVKARRFDAALIAHGRDQYAASAYWKALALAALSGARRKRVCPEGRVPGRKLPTAVGAGLAGAAAILGQHLLAAAFASALLLPLLALAVAVDLVRALTGGGARTAAGARARQGQE
jgi:hypothetical protein